MGNSYRSLDEIYKERKYAEFHSTESITLRNLVQEARKKGIDVRELTKDLRTYAEKISDNLVEQEFLMSWNLPSDYSLESKRIVGIDGSNFPVDGITGTKYVPMSAVSIDFPSGLESKPMVDVKAKIDEISISDSVSPTIEISRRMMMLEGEMLFNVGRDSDEDTIIFLDGPIVDPPMETDNDFVRTRAGYLLDLLARKSITLGIVKLPYGRIFINNMYDIIPDDSGVVSTSFINDLHFFTYLFTVARRKNGLGPILVTKPINITDGTVANKLYGEQGLEIWCFYFQASKGVSPIRVDWCNLATQKQSIDSVAMRNELTNIVSATTYPAMGYPLPVFLAHQKCSIRQGCAEVLVDEIMTGGRAVSEDDAIIIELSKRRI